jgi:hypothetical protein
MAANGPPVPGGGAGIGPDWSIGHGTGSAGRNWRDRQLPEGVIATQAERPVTIPVFVLPAHPPEMRRRPVRQAQ